MGSPACAGIGPCLPTSWPFRQGFPRLRGDRPFTAREKLQELRFPRLRGIGPKPGKASAFSIGFPPARG